jgi:hypothetical protein
MKIETFQEKVQFFCIAILAWAVLFLFVHYNIELPAKMGKKKANDLKNRVVSIIHGLFALAVSGYHLYRDNPQYAAQATQIQHIIMLTSCAYFTYDFFACVFYGLADMSLVIHHGMSLLGIISCEMMNNATTGLIGLFLAEVSNFPMHFRAILRQLQMKYTKLYELADCLYIASYIVARGIFITLLVITATPVSETPLIIRLTCIGLWVQSMYFIYEMIGILKRKAKQLRERSEKSIDLQWLYDHPRLPELSYYKNEGSEKVF